MTWHQGLGLILQFITSVSIACGVYFAIRQIRDSKRAAAVAAYQKIIELHVTLRKLRVGDPSLYKVDKADAVIFDLIQNEAERHEAVRRHFFNLMRLSAFEFAWIAKEEDQLPTDYYADIEARLIHVLKDQNFRNVLESNYAKLHNNKFIKYVKMKAAELS